MLKVRLDIYSECTPDSIHEALLILALRLVSDKQALWSEWRLLHPPRTPPHTIRSIPQHPVAAAKLQVV